MVPTLKWYLTKLIYTYTRTDIVSRPKLDQRGRIDQGQISPDSFLELWSMQKQHYHWATIKITVVKTWVPQANGPVQLQLLAVMQILLAPDVDVIRYNITDIIFNLYLYIDNNDGFHLLTVTQSVSVISLSRESLSFVSRGLSYVTGESEIATVNEIKWAKTDV